MLKGAARTGPSRGSLHKRSSHFPAETRDSKAFKVHGFTALSTAPPPECTPNAPQLGDPTTTGESMLLLDARLAPCH